MADVQGILNKLHIDVIGRVIEYPHTMIRERYKVPKYVADDSQECIRIMVNYFQYHYASWMKVRFTMTYELALAKVKDLLSKKGGFAQSIKNATKGREGGLIAAIDAIAEALKEEATERYIEGVVTSCIDPLDFSLKVALADEYIRVYATHVLPGEKLLSPYELAANFESIIKYHVKWIVSYRNVVT